MRPLDALDVKKVRVIYHTDRYYVQARLPWFRASFHNKTIMTLWFGVDENYNIRNHGTQMVDSYKHLKEAQAQAKEFVSYIEREQINLRGKERNGTVQDIFEIKTPEKDPEHFV